MEILPPNTTCLELSIAMPGFSSSPSSGAKGGSDAMKLLDINQVPSRSEEICMEDEYDDEENPNSDGPAPRKKLRLTKDQSRRLEDNFLHNPTLNPKEKEVLAMELRLKPRQVEVWFQNRRARSKMKQTEIECKYLKRWFGALTEQNRRLQKEVEELRSMKAAPPLDHQTPQVSALSMCSRCERVTTTTLLDNGPATTSTITTANTPSTEGKVRFLQRRRPSAVSNK